MLNFQMPLEKREMFVRKEVHEKALITEVLTVEPEPIYGLWKSRFI